MAKTTLLPASCRCSSSFGMVIETNRLPISKVRSIAHTEDGTAWVAAIGGVARLEGDHWHKVRLDWNFTAKAAFDKIAALLTAPATVEEGF